MKRVRNPLRKGQGTLEYILITTVVAGVVLTIFNGPLQRFLASYKSRQTEYTTVMSQRKLGIPLTWFGGNYPNPGGGAGGNTAADPPVDDPPPATDPGSDTPPATTPPPGATDPASNTPGGERATGYAGPQGSGNQANNSLLSPSRTNSTNTARNRSGRGPGGEGEGRGEDGESSGTITGGGGAGVNPKAEGGMGEDAGAPANETQEEKEARVKREAEADVLKQTESLYGSRTRRVREGSCGDLDIKVILQIVFVIGLFFMLASMLFQKRGRGD